MNEEKQVKGLLVILRKYERSVLCANKNATNTLVKKKIKKSAYPKDSTFLFIYLKLKKKIETLMKNH